MISHKSYKIYSAVNEAFDFSSAQNDDNSIIDDINNASKNAFNDLLKELQKKSGADNLYIEYKGVNQLVINDNVLASVLNICKKHGFDSFIFNTNESSIFSLIIDENLSNCKIKAICGCVYIRQEIDWDAAYKINNNIQNVKILSNIKIRAAAIQLYKIKDLNFDNVLFNCNSLAGNYNILQNIKSTAELIHIWNIDEYPENLSFLKHKKLYIEQAKNNIIDTKNIDILKSIGYSYDMFPNIAEMTLTSSAGNCVVFQYLKKNKNIFKQGKYKIQFGNTWESSIY